MTDLAGYLGILKELGGIADINAGLTLFTNDWENEVLIRDLGNLNGIAPGLGGQNSLAHALISAWGVVAFGFDAAKFAGNSKEWSTFTRDQAEGLQWDSYKDLWNNEVGRQIGLYSTANDLSLEETTYLVLEAYFDGKLINGSLDSRIDPNWLGRPSDFDNNAPIWGGPSGNDHQIQNTFTAPVWMQRIQVIEDVARTLIKCFDEGTPVRLANGEEVPIEIVRVSDYIQAYETNGNNEGRGNLVPGRVRRIFRGTTTEWIELVVGGCGNSIRVTPDHRYLRPDGTFQEIGQILAGDGLVVDAAGELRHARGRILKAQDEGSGASWVEPEPYLIGNVLVKPAPVFGWYTYNFEVEQHHTYIAGGLRVHNDCIAETELLDIDSFSRLNSNGFSVDIVDAITGNRSTLTHLIDPATGGLTYVERKTYFGDGADTYATNIWGSFDTNGDPIGFGELNFTWRNIEGTLKTLNFGTLGDVALRRSHTIVNGLNIESLEWIDTAENPLLSINLEYDPLSTAAQSLTVMETDWSNTELWYRRSTTYDYTGSVSTADILLKDGSRETTEYNTTGQGNLFSRLKVIDTTGSVVTTTTTLQDGTTTKATEVRAPRHVEGIVVSNPGILTGAQIGEVFGAALGQVIGGDNTFARVAAGSVLGTVLGMVGSTFDLYSNGFKVFNDGTTEALSLSEAISTAAGSFDLRLKDAFASAGISAVSSFLTAELNLPEGFGGQLGSVVANSLIGRAISNIAQEKLVFAGFADVTGNIFAVPGSPGAPFGGIGFTTGVAVSSFIGSYLANKVAPAKTLAGSIGSSIGSSLGTLAGLSSTVVGSVASALSIAAATLAHAILGIVLPGIGAFIGAVLGSKIGDFLSDLFSDSDYAWISAGTIQGQDGIQRVGAGGDSQQLLNGLKPFFESARDVTNQVLSAIGGVAVGDNRVELKFMNVDGKLTISLTETNSDSGRLVSLQYNPMNNNNPPRTVEGDIKPSYSQTWKPGRDATAEFDAAVIAMIKRLTIIGGDAYMKAALSQSTTTKVETLGLQLSTAEAFSKILTAFEGLVGGKLSGVSTPNFNVALTGTAAAEATAKSLALTALQQATVSGGNRYAMAALEQSTATDLDLLERQVRVALNYGAALEAVAASFGGTITGDIVPDFNQAFATDADISAFIEHTVIASVKAVAASIESGDIYVKRALATTKATTLDALSGDIAVALDFGRYIANKNIIDAVIAQNPDSAFAAGWVITLLKASELQLDKSAASDFAGGVAGFVKGFGVERYGASLADIAFTVNGTSLSMSIADRSGGTGQTIDISDFASRTGLELLASSAVSNGTNGNDLWFAPDTGGKFTDASGVASGDDVLIGKLGADIIDAGAGDDYIDAGAGDDIVNAGADNDVIRGGAGNDILDGGAGDDTFVFARGDGKDTIRDVVMGTKSVTTTTTRQEETRTAFTIDKFVAAEIINVAGQFAPPKYMIKVPNGKSYTTQPLPSGAFLKPPEMRGYFIQETRYLVEDRTVEVTTTSVVAAQVDGGRDTLRFGSGVSIADLFLKTSASDMIVALREKDATTGAAKPENELSDVVSIADWSNPLSRVENLVFDDGTVVEIGGISRAVSTTDGADTLAGTADNEFLSGGAGDDVFLASAGSDIFVGGAGTDTADYSALATKIDVDLTRDRVIKGDSRTDKLFGIENVVGTSGDDKITGDSAKNVLRGGEGNDVLDGRGGADALFGGAGDDTYYFSRGDGRVTETVNGADTIQETSGDDKIRFIDASILRSQVSFSLSGSDLLITIADPSSTTAYDQIKVAGWLTSDNNRLEKIEFADNSEIGVSEIIYRLDPANALGLTIGGVSPWIDGTSADDSNISGTAADNILRGFAGKDYFYSSGGNDTIDGGDGYDYVFYYNNAVSGVHVNLTTGLALKGDGTTDALFNIETVYGSEFNDTLIGDAGINTLYGRGGNDIMRGEGGDDSFYAGLGTDTIDGGAGNDIVWYYNAASGRRVVVDLEAGTGQKYVVATGVLESTDSLSSIERAYGTTNDDALYGTSGANKLEGAAGNDVLDGRGGADTLIGGEGDDTYIVDNGADVVIELSDEGTDTVQSSATHTLAANVEHLTLTGSAAIDGTGNEFNNTITGNAAANVLDGGAGDDTLYASSGNDTLIGGANGGAGDTLSFAGWSLGVDINLELTTAQVVEGGSVTVSGIENITGGNGNDTLRGTTEANVILAGAGDDLVRISTTKAVGAVDTWDGGDGTDTADFSAFASAVWVHLDYAGVEAWTRDQPALATGSYRTIADLGAFENLTGSAFADDLRGNSAANVILAGAGDDLIRISTTQAVGAIDTWNGGDGTDTGDFSGFASAVWVSLGLTTMEAWTSNTLVATTANATTRLVDFLSIENVVGTAHTDYILGDANSNIYGFTGMVAGSFDFFDGRGGVDTADFSRFGSAVWVNLEYTNVEAWTSNTSVATGQNSNTRALDLVSVENIVGTQFSDTITGDGTDNVLRGGKGNDTLSGGAGSDTYEFIRGDGADIVANNDSSATSTDRMQFAGDVSSENIFFSRLGDDLSVGILGTADSVTFTNWFTEESARVDLFEASDGRRLLASDVEGLINAMAGFSPSSAANASLTSIRQMEASVQAAANAVWRT